MNSYALNANSTKNILSVKRQNELSIHFSSFEQDKMNLIFSDAFKRLANKTQVFDNRNGSNGHKYRTRLTHSLEVSMLSSYIAKELGLNPLVAEILGLLHDIGHPPFGHIGQDTLDEVLKEHTQGKESFEHNNQAVRLVTIIEPLNISNIILNGLKKRKEHGLETPFNYGESQVMNICDAIAYVAGDTQDALELGVLTPEMLVDEPFIQMCFETDNKEELIEKMSDYEFVHKRILVFLSQSLISESLKRFADNKLISYYQFFEANDNDDAPLVALPSSVYESVKLFKKFLYDNVYNTGNMKKERVAQKTILKTLFNVLYQYGFDETNKYELYIGKSYIDRYKNGYQDGNQQLQYVSKERTVVDYLAGCDDKYIQSMYQTYLDVENNQ